jgi:hypothetical protein
LDEESLILQILLRRYGLRVRPEMGRYILAQLRQAQDGQPISIRAGDARTGVAVKRLLAREELRAAIDGFSQQP